MDSISPTTFHRTCLPAVEQKYQQKKKIIAEKNYTHRGVRAIHYILYFILYSRYRKQGVSPR